MFEEDSHSRVIPPRKLRKGQRDTLIYTSRTYLLLPSRAASCMANFASGSVAIMQPSRERKKCDDAEMDMCRKCKDVEVEIMRGQTYRNGEGSGPSFWVRS